ncbi:MAG: ABC transporter permease subunit [Pirellulaceae bacterium]|jgi:hypothetical protein|nr:ABC transporter permease subunit [Pirellulaceae bacterium]MDP7019543.1 ABC transporter permease subunit [Pirellulaceae bacterium]
MINGALFRKTLRDSAAMIVVVVAAVAAFQILFVWAMEQLGPDVVELWQRLRFMRGLFKSMFGVDIAEHVSWISLLAVGLSHPFVFAACWASVLTVVTRTLTSEVDQGTADLLLALPIRRVDVYTTVAIPVLLINAAICLAAWLGIAMASRIVEGPEPIPLGGFGIACVNLFALQTAIAGLTALVSSLVNRRALALSFTLAILLASFVLNFLEAFLDFAQRLSFLGVLSYFRPVDPVRTGEWPWSSIAALLAFGVACWIAGGFFYARKDIPAR